MISHINSEYILLIIIVVTHVSFAWAQLPLLLLFLLLLTFTKWCCRIFIDSVNLIGIHLSVFKLFRIPSDFLLLLWRSILLHVWVHLVRSLVTKVSRIIDQVVAWPIAFR